MSTTIPKRVKRTKVLSTKVTERDNRYMQAMVKRYYEEGHIHQAKTSTLLRLIVKAFCIADTEIAAPMNRIKIVRTLKFFNCIISYFLIILINSDVNMN